MLSAAFFDTQLQPALDANPDFWDPFLAVLQVDVGQSPSADQHYTVELLSSPGYVYDGVREAGPDFVVRVASEATWATLFAAPETAPALVAAGQITHNDAPVGVDILVALIRLVRGL